MGKVVPLKRHKRSGRGRVRRLEKIKDELLRFHGIDLDSLLASEPASTLTIDEFEDLTERILTTIDAFCEEHPSVTVHDVLYTLENVKDIIKDNSTTGEIDE
ncbi:hypothetical protein DBT_1917 [Dissulfuribacter thermophilus]|uniref:Uncharacterized protein n=1 Tax=Dissulfuribacter thermophilus TaxID=1156395 RepID=A0A1B9F421_9BACT|nr:hypothetical protein [Dissulfuribacter thermophilus]OCC14603.1 hypothetical protein DBT_1917 [Dissulfuribacter thermophilus]